MAFEMREVVGDLFTADCSLAHCVSADLAMSYGIATQFVRRFPNIRDALVSLRLRVGDVGQVRVRGADATPPRFIFNLVTKEKYWHKPTYESLRACLERLRELCEKCGITRIAMPTIGCGLDGLRWAQVSRMLREVFADTDVHITVFKLK